MCFAIVKLQCGVDFWWSSGTSSFCTDQSMLAMTIIINYIIFIYHQMHRYLMLILCCCSFCLIKMNWHHGLKHWDQLLSKWIQNTMNQHILTELMLTAKHQLFSSQFQHILIRWIYSTYIINWVEYNRKWYTAYHIINEDDLWLIAIIMRWTI